MFVSESPFAVRWGRCRSSRLQPWMKLSGHHVVAMKAPSTLLRRVVCAYCEGVDTSVGSKGSSTMSTPESGTANENTGSSEPAETTSPTAAQSAVQSAVPTAAPGTPSAPIAPPQAGARPLQAGAGPDAWWAAPLPPRQRWIAPARRRAVIAIAAAGAVVMFGLGAIAGSLLHGDRHEARQMPVFRPDGFGQFQPGPGGDRFGQMPRRFAPQPSATPRPSTTS